MKIKTAARNTLITQRTRRTRSLANQKLQNRFKSIIVPIDFSETSLKALDYAVALAEQFGSQIRLLHVLESPAIFSSPNPAFANWDNQANEFAKTRLAELADEKINELIPVNCEVRIGRAYQVVCETAKKQQCDLIIIGTHGFTGLKHLFLGSTAERVIRHAPCSVLVVRKETSRNANATLKPKNILVPTDFSKPADQALRSAIEFAKQYEAKIHLLYVVPVHYAVGEYDVADYAMLVADQKETGQKKLFAISQRLRKNFSVTTQIRHGRPAVEINQVAAELDCDLVIISTHGLTGWKRVLLGSTTEEVVRHSSCPVLVTKHL